MYKQRKKVKERSKSQKLLEVPIDSLSEESLLLLLKTNKPLFNEFKRQKKLLLKKDLEVALLQYKQLFYQLDQTEFHFELQLLISSFHLATKDRHTYKQLHREILSLLKANQKRPKILLNSSTENYCNIKLKKLLIIKKSELQIKVLHFLLKIQEGKTIQELGYRFTAKDLDGLTLKKLTRLLKLR